MSEPTSTANRVGPTLTAALVVLAVVAGSGAYLIARQILRPDANVVAAPSLSTAPASSSAPPGPEPAPATGTSTATQPTAPTPTADECPAFTVAAVRAAGRPGNLERVLYVDATREGSAGAEAWICRDTDGTLYYQGHDKRAPATAATSDVTILIGAGVRGMVVAAGLGFVATNPGRIGETQYIVTREVLAVLSSTGGREEYTVTRSRPS